jgi:tetratricopeptide (TPR) repeat protein
VRGYPTFVLADSTGAPMGRWAGYGTAEPWIAQLEEALADQTTYDAKRARFAESPTASDAVTLAEYATDRQQHAEAVDLFRKAQELDPATADSHNLAILENTARGARSMQFTLDQVRSAADAVMESASAETMDVMQAAYIMQRVAGTLNAPELMAPYLEKAIAASEGSKSEGVKYYRERFLVDQALHIEKNPARALELKRGQMREGWLEDPSQLNSFAWWCFENELNLEEAEALARKGVALAEDGDRANILDTLAEIVNASGRGGEALSLIDEALALEPENEYLQKQRARFAGDGDADGEG